MSTPTTASTGATCTKVAPATRLNTSGQQQDGSSYAYEYFLIYWTGVATCPDCEGATDGTTTVPVRGQPHPTKTLCNVSRTEITPVTDETRTYFKARIEYSDTFTTPVNPLDAPPDITWSFAENGEVPYFKDYDPAGAKAVVNTAKDQFADFLQHFQVVVTAEYSINIAVSAWNTTAAQQVITYTKPTPATNSDTFNFDSIAIGIGQARIRGITVGDLQIMNGVKYRVKKFSLAFADNWTQTVDSRGFNEKDPTHTGQVRPITAGPSIPNKPDRPWPLDSSGAKLPNITDTPATITFYPYQQLPFSVFSFT